MDLRERAADGGSVREHQHRSPRHRTILCRLLSLTSSAIIPSVLILAVSSLPLAIRLEISLRSFLAMASFFSWSILVRSMASLSWIFVRAGLYEGIVGCAVGGDVVEREEEGWKVGWSEGARRLHSALVAAGTERQAQQDIAATNTLVSKPSLPLLSAAAANEL